MSKEIIPDKLSITILNWDVHNPKKDNKKHTWFKVSNTIFHDDKFRLLNNFEKVCFIFLLAKCSQVGSKSFITCTQLDSNLAGSRRKTQYYQALIRLELLGLISKSEPQNIEYRIKNIDSLQEKEKEEKKSVAGALYKADIEENNSALKQSNREETNVSLLDRERGRIDFSNILKPMPGGKL